MAYLLTMDKKNNLKSLNLKPEDFDYLAEGGKAGELYARVPWLYRGVTIRAQALSRMPFSIMRGETEVDSSDNYQNNTGVLPDPFSLLYLVEAALVMFGRAYILPQKNKAGIKKGMRWLLPTTIEPVIDPVNGIMGWRRSLNNEQTIYPTDGLVYIWQPNPFSEIMPGQPPASAALAAAGVLRNIDKFAAAFFDRGAIKATILTVDNPNPQREQLEQLKNFWSRAVMGIRNAWSNNVFSTVVKPVVIGEGLESLNNGTLTNEKREDIATALGVPHSLLFSNAANFATAQQDDKSFYDKTVVPDALLIQQSLNSQFFAPMGYNLQFRPEALGINQEDETSRAAAYASYVNAGMKPSIAAQILGITLPDGIEYEMLDDEPEPEVIDVTEQAQPEPAPMVEDEDDQEQEELEKYQRKALNALSKGKSPAVDFQPVHLDSAKVQSIKVRLSDCRTADDVRAVFAERKATNDFWELTNLLREAIRG